NGRAMRACRLRPACRSPRPASLRAWRSRPEPPPFQSFLFFHPSGNFMSSTDTLEPTAPVTTVKAYLRPIDAKGLADFAAGGKANPARRGTNKVHTVMEGQYRSLSHV